jgi:hypothetical protein
VRRADGREHKSMPVLPIRLLAHQFMRFFTERSMHDMLIMLLQPAFPYSIPNAKMLLTSTWVGGL